MIKIGIIGCGTIGSKLASLITTKYCRTLTLGAIYDIDSAKAGQLIRSLKITLSPSPTVEGLFEKTNLIIEAANKTCVSSVLGLALKYHRDVMIMSVGGILENIDVLKKFEEEKVRLYVPSGAIAGIDGVKAARLGGLKKLVITTRKPPKGFANAPYVETNKINLANLKKATMIFEGPAREAIKAFPQNINVGAVLSLAGLGMEKTMVRIVVDPASASNTHEIEASGDFGRIHVVCDNRPSAENPKTSTLAILSAECVLASLDTSVRIGT